MGTSRGQTGTGVLIECYKTVMGNVQKSLPAGFLLFGTAFAVRAQHSEPLRQVGAIALPGVEGRIDHLSIDIKNQRLFVCALGNNTLEVLDVRNRTRLHTISGLREPQGALYVPTANRLYVANGGDGSLRIFDAASFALLKTISYSDDADNVRYDPAAGRELPDR